MNRNTEFDNGESAWFWTQGEELPFPRFPFGCKVLNKPSATKVSVEKWEEPSSVGVFAGYVIHPGYKSKGEYYVWDLTDFSRGADLSLPSPQIWASAYAGLMSPRDVTCMMVC